MLKIQAVLQLLMCIPSLTLAAESCGVQSSAYGLIFGGVNIKPGDWPWVVPLFYRQNNEFFCSSNLISHRHLLTGSYRSKVPQFRSINMPAESIYAYVGIYDITKGNVDPVAREYNIRRIAVHPNWNAEAKNFDSDIALLTTYDNIEFTQFVQPVCLPDATFQIGVQSGQVVGYGKSESTAIHENVPKRTQIFSHSNDDCFFAAPNYAQVGSPTTFCAGEVGKNPCKGDSGGGFFIRSSEWRIAGLVSSALDDDCATNQFVLFTNVAKLLPWIQTEMERLDSDSDSMRNSFFDIDEEKETVDPYQYADCRYELTSDAYTCHANDLMMPDNDISLAVNNGGQHVSGRSNRDVTTVSMKNGQVTHFPELSKVVETFPKITGVSITFTKLKHIKRAEMTALRDLKFFLISDNELEVIPSDTFYDMQKLVFIDICRNKVRTLDPYWTITMPNLKTFKARSNEFTTVPKDLFARNPLLEEVLLDKNKIQMNEKDFTSLKNIKTIAMLNNTCINIEFCRNGSKVNDKCVRSLQQFNYILYGYCNRFTD